MRLTPLVRKTENGQILKISLKIQQPFITIVGQIFVIKQKASQADTSSLLLEQQIDAMVYKLYDLTPEEIAIVEGRE